MLKNKIRYISFFYLFALLGGAIFFIPAIFVNRFISAPELWMQIGICIGVSGYILLIKQKIFFPLPQSSGDTTRWSTVLIAKVKTKLISLPCGAKAWTVSFLRVLIEK